MTVQRTKMFNTSKSIIGTNQLNPVLYCRRVALIGAMWVRPIATCWQSICILKSDGSYLQTFINLSESGCSGCLENGWDHLAKQWHGVRSLRVSLNQELAADLFFWASSRKRSTCLWLLIVIFKGHWSLVRHIVLLWEAAASRGCVISLQQCLGVRYTAK